MVTPSPISSGRIFADRDEAADALAISVRTFESLVASNEAPQPRQISKQRVGWLWRELIAFAESRPVSRLPPGPKRKRADEGEAG